MATHTHTTLSVRSYFFLTLYAKLNATLAASTSAVVLNLFHTALTLMLGLEGNRASFTWLVVLQVTTVTVFRGSHFINIGHKTFR